MRRIGINRFKSNIAIGGGGGSTPSFRSAGTLDASVSGTTCTPGLPAGTAENDILIVCLTIGGDQSTTGWPTVSGWTLEDSTSNSIYSAARYWRRAGVSETATTFDIVTNDPGRVFAGVCAAYKDCITTGTPYADFNRTTPGGTSATPPTLAVTPTVDNGLLVQHCLIEDDTAWTVSPPPVGWSTAYDLSTDTGTDCRHTCIHYDTATEDNSTQIDAITIGTLAVAEWYSPSCLVLKPAT